MNVLTDESVIALAKLHSDYYAQDKEKDLNKNLTEGQEDVRVVMAKTKAVNHTYPSSGNTFEIVLGELEYDNDPEGVGDKPITGFTEYDPQEVRIVRTLDGSYIAENNYVVAFLINGRWWILAITGGGGGYFVLAEDADDHPVKAYEGTLGSTSAITIDESRADKLFDLYYVNNVLRAPKKARAGYSGMYVIINNQKVFVGNACINSCSTTATISGSPSSGTVGEVYSYTMTFSDLDGSGISASNLPPGLTINSTTGEISGTPSTAGTYEVRFTGTGTGLTPCLISRIFTIIIAPEG